MMELEKLQCGRCPKKICWLGFSSDGPSFCPMKTKLPILEDAKKKLQDKETKETIRAVALTWKDSGLNLTRVEETMIFAKHMGYKKLGIGFCIGLSEEVEILSNILENNGFDVVSACCVAGGLSSEDMDIKEEEKIFPGRGRQPQCNPVGQAFLLNEQKTDLNILFGLCTGDDTVFIKHSEAPITVLAVKDRVLGHNPLAAIYTSKRFYTRLQPGKPKKGPW